MNPTRPSTARQFPLRTPADHFELVRAAFEAAAQRAGTIERFYEIAGQHVRLCFAGPALVEHLTPALEHLRTGRVPEPDLTVCLWDLASSGVDVPPPSWGGDAYGARGEIAGFNDERNRTNVQLDGPGLRRVALNLLDLDRGVGLYWIPDANDFPYHERSSPLRLILHWWFAASGHQIVHSGAVGRPDGGVLLAGKGGSGKSTSALSCLESSLLYVSDDYLLLTPDPPYAHSLYSSAKLNGDHIHRLGHLLPLVANAERMGEEKAILYLAGRYRGKLTPGFPVRAIVLPRVTGSAKTLIRPAGRGESLFALAPSTVFQLPGAGRAAFDRLALVARNVPSFVMELGADIPDIPNRLSELLERL